MCNKFCHFPVFSLSRINKLSSNLNSNSPHSIKSNQNVHKLKLSKEEIPTTSQMLYNINLLFSFAENKVFSSKSLKKPQIRFSSKPRKSFNKLLCWRYKPNFKLLQKPFPKQNILKKEYCLFMHSQKHQKTINNSQNWMWKWTFFIQCQQTKMRIIWSFISQVTVYCNSFQHYQQILIHLSHLHSKKRILQAKTMKMHFCQLFQQVFIHKLNFQWMNMPISFALLNILPIFQAWFACEMHKER